VAFAIQGQMFPGESRVETAKPAGFQSGETVENKGDRKIKTTKISWADMAKRANAGYDTSIKGV